jgi:hypothetical protein
MGVSCYFRRRVTDEARELRPDVSPSMQETKSWVINYNVYELDI